MNSKRPPTLQLPISIIFCFVFSTQLIGQNLVPNGSFEDTVQCPTPNSQIQYASDWISPNAYSPDYFHSCANSTNPNYGTPNNWYGNQNAKTGVAYAGIYMPVNAGNNLREYVQIQLTNPLVAETEYVVRFYVSLGDSAIFSVNSIGAYLSGNAIYSPDLSVFNVTPQIVNDPITSPLIDDSVWYEISDSIIAVGGEQYITIGNFQFDNNADTTSVSGGDNLSFGAYYYLDDVTVSENPTSINEFNSSKTFKIYPNPVSTLLSIEINNIGNYYFQLFDMVGNIVSEKRAIKGQYNFNVAKYSNGLYFFQISNKNTILSTNKLIINH